MFYKKRIEELERTVALLIAELEKEEAIGTFYKYAGDFIRFGGDGNKRLAEEIQGNRSDVRHLFEYLGVMYVTESTRLVKKKKKKEGK